jgi:hypothetical protein
MSNMDLWPRFPQGKRKALVLSYDDGSEHDRHLIEILNHYGLHGTFHLNSGKLGAAHHVSRQEINSLYAGHEVACHTVSHCDLTSLSAAEIRSEVEYDKRALEDLSGQPVRGLAYPFGSYDEHVVRCLSELGMNYARTTTNTGRFELPTTFLTWHPTCHHNLAMDLGKRFLAQEHEELRIMLVWGHSYELDGFMTGDRSKDWQYMGSFCQLMHGQGDIYSTTAAEVAAYLQGVQHMTLCDSEPRLRNPSTCVLWVSVRGRVFEIPPDGALDLRVAREQWVQVKDCTIGRC